MDHDTECLETLTFTNHLTLLGCTTDPRSLTLTANRRHFYGDATTSLSGYNAHIHAAALLTTEHGHTGKAKSAVSDVGVKKLAKIMLGEKKKNSNSDGNSVMTPRRGGAVLKDS